jgi:hypothetical protein
MVRNIIYLGAFYAFQAAVPTSRGPPFYTRDRALVAGIPEKNPSGPRRDERISADVRGILLGYGKIGFGPFNTCPNIMAGNAFW